jgi:hypothetical protein
MTPTELQRLLTNNKLSQVDVAKELDMSDRNIRRYISGELTVPKTVEYALRWIVSQRQNTPRK